MLVIRESMQSLTWEKLGFKSASVQTAEVFWLFLFIAWCLTRQIKLGGREGEFCN